MPKRMLIDASHPEETRVVVLDGQKVEEFDFEAASKRPLKGNIYLAKVTRVEPSLQAAFVEYGGNRQGFLAFSEIHPDYYQIPVADRLALLAEQEAEARRRADDEIESFDIAPGPKPESSHDLDESDAVEAEAEAEGDGGFEHEDESGNETSDPSDALAEDSGSFDEDPSPSDPEGEHAEPQALTDDTELSEASDADQSESTVSDTVHAEAEGTDETGTSGAARPLQTPRPPQRWMRKRHYKIQEVIKRRQILLVQVVKEERGNKGAALTTYLSLAGRYCVLMPNTPRGGGISRKITNANDRKRLKSAAQALELPEGMGLIIRTAGENRTKIEIKRDYEYLLRSWDAIRELTLKSNAPACVYEEGDLVKRAIRDLYNKDVTEVLVEGDEGYRNAKEFMRMLMPSHAKNVKQYKEAVPLFHRHHIEAQLDAMFSPVVTLKSGGYIVINQTEALVSIDVNSGRATREHSIEETARKTNLEAADEIGRQLRLRDLAGLIVIDFIDMEDSRNDRDVERRLREAVKNDRARIQIGKISQFGLLEMSRQRLRAGVIAGSTVPCPHCGGQGIVRSVESTSLRVLRGLEEEGQKLKASAVRVRVASDVAIYTLNQKRRELARIEHDYGMAISFEPKEGLMAGTFEIERTAQMTAEERARFAATAAESPIAVLEEEDEEVEEIPSEEELGEEDSPPNQQPEASSQPQPSSTSRRRRRRRGGRGRSGERPPQGQPHQGQSVSSATRETSTGEAGTLGAETGQAEAHTGSQGEPSPGNGSPSASPGQPGAPRKRRRRRGRRGGANRAASGAQPPSGHPSVQADEGGRFGVVDEIDTTPRAEPIVPAREDRAPTDAVAATPNGASTPVWSLGGERSESAARPSEASTELIRTLDVSRRADTDMGVTSKGRENEPSQPAKRGWWQRTFRSDG